MGDTAQRHRSTSGAADTIDGKVVPIVFVPGVMGSRLKFRNKGPAWDPDDGLGFAGLAITPQEKLAKHLSSENKADPDFDLTDDKLDVIRSDDFVKTVPDFLPAPAADDKDPFRTFFERRGWGTVVFGFYGKLLIDLERRLNEKTGGVPYPVFAVGYDWRQSNFDSGHQLNLSITSILQEFKEVAKKVVIVTHSMGGLVTLAAHHEGFADRVAGVVHCVMPSTGAVVAYRRFQTGASLEFDGPPDAASGIDWIKAKFLNAVMGETREEYALTQAGLRGPLQLLPSNKYPALFLNILADDGVVRDNTDPNFPDLYDIYLRDEVPGIVPKANSEAFIFPPATFITPADVAKLKANIRLARDFHNKISLNPTALDESFVLIGDAVSTDVQFDWLLGKSMQREDFAQKVIKAPAGDGTVPAVSAEFRFANPDPINRDPNSNPRTLNTNSIFNGAQHADCFQNASLVDKVVRNVQLLTGKAKKA
jgi:hypothetical protein